MFSVYLNKGEEDRILKGNQWIFSNEVLRFEGDIVSGEVCNVYTFDGEFLCRGFFNSSSKIMVRVLTLEQEDIDYNFFYKRLSAAKAYRDNLGFTNTGRQVFSEADLLPGLIVDKYADYLSIQILSLGFEKIKSMIVDILVRLYRPIGIYERSDVSIRKKEGLEEFKGLLYGEVPDRVLIEENGIKLYVDIINGQKTGYFLDQKENRKALRDYTNNKVVLDCFSHTGGFALNAATNAHKVVAVDISEKACDDILTNVKLNDFNNVEVVCENVFDYLRYSENKYRFDVIVLDPPAFTKSKETVEKAYRGYKDINLQALKMVKPGGFLVTFSCSQHMTPALFLEMIMDASIDSKRTVKMVDFRVQSKDHPTLLNQDESFYLKCVVLNVL